MELDLLELFMKKVPVLRKPCGETVGEETELRLAFGIGTGAVPTFQPG